jgi:hypothetical protein
MTKIGWLTITLLFCYLTSIGQPAAIKGQVKDAHNEEAIPFASVVIKPVRAGVITDSLGFFTINLEPGTPIDSLEITYVGYEKFTISLQGITDSTFLKINLVRAVTQGVVIKTKADRGLILWRKMVRNKPRNDRSRFPYFAYELHNKLELDFNKINKEKLEKEGHHQTLFLYPRTILTVQKAGRRCCRFFLPKPCRIIFISVARAKPAKKLKQVKPMA